MLLALNERCVGAWREPLPGEAWPTSRVGGHAAAPSGGGASGCARHDSDRWTPDEEI